MKKRKKSAQAKKLILGKIRLFLNRQSKIILTIEKVILFLTLIIISSQQESSNQETGNNEVENIITESFPTIIMTTEIKEIFCPKISLKIKVLDAQRILSDSYSGAPPEKIEKNDYVKDITGDQNLVYNITDINNNIINMTWDSTPSNLSYMFSGLDSISEILFEHFDFSGVTCLSYMFYNCIKLEKINISNNISSNAQNMQYMFANCNTLTSLYLKSLNLINAENLNHMFSNCSSLTSINLEISNSQNLRNVDMTYFFFGCYSLISVNLKYFNIKNVENINMQYFFADCTSLKSINFQFFDLNTVSSVNMSYMFYGCIDATNFNLNNFDVSKVKSMQYMFYGCINLLSLNLNNFHQSEVIEMGYMFYDCRKLETLNMNNFQTPNAVIMTSMFSKCYYLKNLYIGSFQTSSVLYMDSMFSNCLSLTSLNLSSFDVSNVIDMSLMFQGCKYLTILDLSNFVTSHVTDMNKMFYGCLSLTSLNVENFTTVSVTNMSSMFYRVHSLTSLNLQSFHTPNVIDISKMFAECSLLLKLRVDNLKFQNVTNMNEMFSGCSSLISLRLNNFVINSGTTYDKMFEDCNIAIIYCINDGNSAYNNLIESHEQECSSTCFTEENHKLIQQKNKCILDCSADDSYKIEYGDICNNFCPYHTYYNYNRTQCIEEIPEGYYCNDSNSRTIDKCHEHCSTCMTGPYPTDNNCKTCKEEYSFLAGSLGKNCYSNVQNIQNYVYDKETRLYQNCYPTCLFCSKKNTESSQSKQNCLTCQDGYLKSYKYMQNCYQINQITKSKDIIKIVNSPDDVAFININTCTNGYIIVLTGECVEKCPSETPYHTYVSDPNLMYNLIIESTPKYTFGMLCYDICPTLTYPDDNTNTCKCIYAWHQNKITREIICYDNKNYCLSNKYYYHVDTRECSLNSCNDGYYQHNFECYPGGCPSGTRETSPKKCVSNFNHCYIDIHYKTFCSNVDNIRENEYNLKYDDSNIYFKSCNESMFFFDNKTYLQNYICYKECPEYSKIDESGLLCICSYFFFNNSNMLDCFNPLESCESRNFEYSNIELVECFTDRELCIKRGNCFINIYDPITCPYQYKAQCYQKCPESTCITQRLGLLNLCVDIKPTMKIFNNICFEGIYDIVNDLENFKPISTNLGITINAYSIVKSTDELINEFPNLTFVDLGECGVQLKNAYSLPLDTNLYILAIDTPNFDKLSTINSFDYEIYLVNGTQIKNLTPCNNIKLSVSSSIKDLERAQFGRATQFNSSGFDIYNETDEFYTDFCSSASDNGNDISFKERKTIYYPENLTICNEGCQYGDIDYETQRFICNCDTEKNESNSTNKEEEKDIYKTNFLDSYLNYRIILCSSWFFSFKGFHSNFGFYIGFIILFSCIFFFILFWIKGLKILKNEGYSNIPNQRKLKEEFEKQKELIDDECDETNQERKFTIVIQRKAPKIGKKGKVQRKKNNMFQDKLKDDDKKFKNVEKNILNLKKSKKRKSTLGESYFTKNSISTLISNQNILNNVVNIKHNFEFDLDFGYLFQKRDEEVEKSELNEIPFRQALRIDNRDFKTMLLYILGNKIEVIRLIFFQKPYEQFSLNISVYLFQLLLDFTMNAALYTDDIVSEKYHNDGQLSAITSFSLSIASNIISSIIIYIISKLTSYVDYIEMIFKSVKNTIKFNSKYKNFLKILKVRILFYFFFEFIIMLFLVYYIYVFCAVYRKSQVSLLINYLIGVATSMATSFGISIVITILRYIGLTYRKMRIFLISKYIYQNF